MIGVLVLNAAMMLSHHGEQLAPVVIHKTGLGFWESVADGRHLSRRQRSKFIAALGAATFPVDADPSTKWGRERMADHVRSMSRREDRFLETGLLVEDYLYFDPHRQSLINHAKARGICIIWPDDN